MAIKIKTGYVALIVVALLGGVFFTGWTIGRKITKRHYIVTVDSLNQAITRYQVTINKINTFVATVEQETASLREQLRKGEVENLELRALNITRVSEITRLKLKIDTLLTNVDHGGLILFRDTCTGDGQVSLLLPFNFYKNDEWLKLKGMFNIDGKLDIDLKMFSDVDVYTGIDKTTKVPICVVTTDNPYLQTLNISSYKFDAISPKKWGVGVVAGYGLVIDKTPEFRPFIGIGVSRTFIRW